MASRKNFRDRVQQRRNDATERQAVRDKRSDAEQLAVLNARYCGGCREAQKLQGKLSG